MKKCIISMITILLFFCFMTTVYAADEINIIVNGKKIEFTKNKPYIFDRDNRVVVPIKEIAEAIEAEVVYDEEKNIITFSKKYDINNGAFYDNFFDDGKEFLTLYQVSFRCGELAYWVYLETSDNNGNVVGQGEWFGISDCISIYNMDTEKVFVPIKYVAEEFGYTVTWDAKTATVTLSNENTKTMGHKLGSKQNHAFLSEIMPNIQALSECVEEMFCADVDFNEEYAGVYQSEQQYDDGSGKPIILYNVKEEAPKGDYFRDPTESSYYSVRNLKTNEEVRQYLRNYMTDDIINKWFHNDFLEYNGNLYLRRGSRGYGAVVCHAHSGKFLEQKDDKYYITVDFLYFDDFDHKEVLEFTRIGEKWIITKEYEL